MQQDAEELLFAIIGRLREESGEVLAAAFSGISKSQVVTFYITTFYAEITQDSKCEASKLCGSQSTIEAVPAHITWLTAPEVLLLGFKRERASRQFELCTVLTCLFDDAIMLMCLPEQHAPIQSPRVSLLCVKDALQARSNRRNNGLG